MNTQWGSSLGFDFPEPRSTRSTTEAKKMLEEAKQILLKKNKDEEIYEKRTLLATGYTITLLTAIIIHSSN